MTKLTAPTSKKLTALGFKEKSEEEAKTVVNAFLIKNGIEGMEDEELETLIDLAESFVDLDENPAAEEPKTETEEELEELAAEEEIPAKKPVSKTPAKKTVVVEEEEEEIPAKKAVAKAATKPVAKAAVKEVAKSIPKKEEVVKTAKATKLNPKDVEEDRVHFEFLKALFPDEDYLYAWISNAGVTVKYKGKNSNRAVLSLENGSVKADDTFVATLYLPTFNGHVDGLTENGIDHEICWSGVPFIKALDIDELTEILTALLPSIETSVNKLDKKLGENRTKMEENLKKSAKSEAPAAKASAKETVKPAVAKTAAPVVDKVAAAKAKIAEAKSKTKKVVVEEEE